MLSDPQTLVVNSSTLTLPAVGRGDQQSSYSYVDSTGANTYTFTVSHQYKVRNRFSVRLDVARIVSDPLIPANSVPASASVYLIVDVPSSQTILPADAQHYGAALVAWLGTSTNLARVIGGET